MATYAGAAVAILVAGMVLGLAWRNRGRRIAALEHELDDVYQAQQILERARVRKDRKHLHLLAIPLAWLAGKLQGSTVRLAAATAVSALVTTGSFIGVEAPVHPPRSVTPPAGAETTVPTPTHGTPPGLQYPTTTKPSTTTTTSLMVAAEASLPPASSAVVGVESASPAESPPSTMPTPPTSTTSTTSTTVLEVKVPRVCINPVPADLHLCLVE
jgi:hypothetical protein